MTLTALPPQRLLVLSFASLILAGTALLHIAPGVLVEGKPDLLTVDSLFTATSAVCVTGLIVRDTAAEFTFLGQAIILALIQLGGLGILTFTNVVILARRGRVGLSGRMLLQESHGLLPNLSPPRLMREILVFTFAMEAVGALVLTLRFSIFHGYTIIEALWLGTFHSISAFCNAGFSLFSDSLISYNSDWIVNLTIMILIVTGGIGFVVFSETRIYCRNVFRRPRPRFSLHSRAALRVTCFLILGGWLLIVPLEFVGRAMTGSLGDRVLQCLFLSVTSRTAGFNSVDMGNLSNATLLVVMALMFVGGSPGSTAGGIKTTTLATLVGVLSSRTRNRPHIELLDRTLSQETVAKAFATTTGFIITCFVAVSALQITEVSAVHPTLHHGIFLECLFEVVSALGTVGLSTGITPVLTDPGKCIVIACMFLGRLGPVIVAGSLIGRRRRIEYSYPMEDVVIG